LPNDVEIRLPSSWLEVACWPHDPTEDHRRRTVGAQEQDRGMNAAPAVEAIDLVKHFGETRAVDGVSFVVP
jgi:hypothetical protein